MNFTLCNTSSVGGFIEWVIRANLMIVTFISRLFINIQLTMNKKYFKWDIEEKKAEVILTRWSTLKFVHSRIFKCGPDIFVCFSCFCYRYVSRVPKDGMRRWTSAEVYATARCRPKHRIVGTKPILRWIYHNEHFKSHPLLWSRTALEKLVSFNMKITFLRSRSIVVSWDCFSSRVLLYWIFLSQCTTFSALLVLG